MHASERLSINNAKKMTKPSLSKMLALMTTKANPRKASCLTLQTPGQEQYFLFTIPVVTISEANYFTSIIYSVVKLAKVESF